MRYKLLAVDMDGTLLDSGNNIRERTLAALDKARDAGLILTIATGRSAQGVEMYGDLLRLDSPIIVYNGAMIVMPRDGKVLQEIKLEERAASDIIAYGKKFDPTVCVWSDNQLYIFEISERIDFYAGLAGITPKIINDEAALIRQGITKILWYDEADNIEKYQNELEKELRSNVTFCTSSPNFLEFFSGGASKGHALKFLGEQYCIGPSEMIAIGDGMNDLSMIEYAGLGVAMANAPEELKRAADFVTLSNDEDGVAHAIDTYVLS